MNRGSAAESQRAEIGAFDPISLAEVVEAAALQTRVDRKYLIAPDAFADLMQGLAGTCRVLDIDGLRDFRYESVYFDTAGLDSYRRAATGRRRKFKVRTRSYLDSGGTVLEVKTEGGREETVKDRLPTTARQRDSIDPAGLAFVDARIDVPAHELRPVLTTTYHRATLVDADAGFRMTCDAGLRLSDRAGTVVEMTDHVLVETKSLRGAGPADRLLWRLGHRPVPISKYCVGMAAVDPGLPANRWNRTLRRYFGWRPA
ncbi:polyphosphate polymerase domain-containing protein [Nocardioides jensenii]|uniref:polyphosphate polymerase domain-containing protein n=1 Tax=Nocardioides jensenii TaxID=1843 RepID=UPI000832B722|nr:polyphosphate polymerase domain-containing protein [Nocardioides jensenii]